MQEETPSKISPYSSVTVTKMGHIVEVQHMERQNRKSHIQKIDKERYVDIASGEVRWFKQSVTRGEQANSLRQTFKKLRYLINANFSGKGNELHITLTYKENMTDTKKLYRDFDKFIKRFRYRYGSEPGEIDYMTIVEPQERGAWHHHLLVRFNNGRKAFLPNDEVAEIWGHGFIKISTLTGVDNIGAYLSAYLADVELTDLNVNDVAAKDLKVKVVEVKGEEKKFIKGGRLHLYPTGMNLYRKSKGIKMPIRVEMEYKDIKKVVGSAKPNYKKSIRVEKEDFKNVITYEQYNMKR